MASQRQQPTLMDPVSAQTELQEHLNTALEAQRLSKTQLAHRADLSRTTVSNALNRKDLVPSPETVRALATALNLDPKRLVSLRNTASPHRDTAASGPGQPINECDPYHLGIHPAVEAPLRLSATRSLPHRGTAALTSYIGRAHDEQLAQIVEAAVGGQSRMAVLVGSSSIGKTRACWEVIRSLSELGWRLWHPFDLTCAEAALADMRRVVPRTVIWLDDAQNYLGAGGGLGERIAAALHTLLTDSDRAPVLILGTLWEDPASPFPERPIPGRADPHAQVRALLKGHRIPVPSAFGEAARTSAKELAEKGNRQLAYALEHTIDGRLAQTLAGAPELVRRYLNASPGARALMRAAMDARRLGVGLHLPRDFLVEAAEGYLSDEDYEVLDDDWVAQALRETSTTVVGDLAPLRQVRPRRSHNLSGNTAGSDGPVCRLASYLEQYGRYERDSLCPPLSFWLAAEDHLTCANDLVKIAEAACRRGFLRYAARLCHRIPRTDRPTFPSSMLNLMSSYIDPHWNGLRWFIDHTALDDAPDLTYLAIILHQKTRRGLAIQLLRRAADHVGPTSTRALASMVTTLRWLGHRDFFSTVDYHGIASTLAIQAAVHADPTNTADTMYLVGVLRQAGLHGYAAQLLPRTASHADPSNTTEAIYLVELLERLGHHEMATDLAIHTSAHADPTNTRTLTHLASTLRRLGQHETATRLLTQAAACVPLTNTPDTTYLIGVLHEFGHCEASARLAARAAAQTDPTETHALVQLASTLCRLGHHETATRLATRAASHADPTNTADNTYLIEALDRLGHHETATRLATRTASHADPTNTRVSAYLASMLKNLGLDEIAIQVLTDANPQEVTESTFLIGVFHETGLHREAMQLAIRSAAHTDPTDTYSVNRLLHALRAMNQRKAIQVLENRSLDAGSLAKLPDSISIYGREINGSPSQPWTWDEQAL
ncbi:helix-turn-helix transcriptional regulator [Nocardiopsis tropica]|uniref:Helix-turn-helix transcriptional regulator n=1 Tax=Nocardiopsis tropica TaxID=109330 RepID=A0ABU7KWK6_9ACTN|nr:helix-turn-helix transcriptional regulator [Nocardiopsis umidischolae]MEE2053649.1 helix-turn-helix transcriptional regulator [Nocardiopsis umidischolae]